jgi:branched-chain amino acid transport system substrate-binding protein
MNPDALYYGGVMQAAAKLAPQAYEIMPQTVKAGSDGVYDTSWPKQSGKEAIEGWYCSQASPELLTDPKLEAWVTKYKNVYKRDLTNYAVTAYNGVYVIADAIERTAKANKPLTRSNVRDAIQATKINSNQGPISFDENGDITNRTVSIYQLRDGAFKYVGVAPQK